MPLPLCSESLSLCSQRRKGPSQLPGGRKDAGISCLPCVSPSAPPHSLPVPSISASDHSAVCLGLDAPPHSISPASIYPDASWHSWHDRQPWLFLFVLERTTGSSCWTCRHSICFLTVPAARKEWVMPMEAALCGGSPPTAERLTR